MEPAAQQALFDFYQATLDALMERAKREGALGELPDVAGRAWGVWGVEWVRDSSCGANREELGWVDFARGNRNRGLRGQRCKSDAGQVA